VGKDDACSQGGGRKDYLVNFLKKELIIKKGKKHKQTRAKEEEGAGSESG